METARETNPNWSTIQEVTAKLRQTEKQAETIKDNLRQLNSAWAARPQLHHIHRPREEQLDVVSSQVERKARDLSDWPLLLKKESGIRRYLLACLGPSCRGLRLCGKGLGTSASPLSRDEAALQDKPPLRRSQLEALAPTAPAGLKQTENSSLASTSTGIVSPPELPEEPCLERHAAVDDAHEVPQLIRVRADRQDVRETPRQQDTLTTLPEHLPRDLMQKYKFIDAHSLGSGAVARVCRMQELETGRHVAVKVVEKYPLQIRNMITQMEREIRVHKRLCHPNILHLHACFEDSTHWYMVLELASRLVNLLVRHPWKRLREPQAGWLFGQVVDGVSHLHQNGCVHRDLKPDNVLMVEDCPKICDFGWCAELNEGQRRTFCGTFDYMAPEVIFGEGHGSEADVWSLGITLYEVCHLVNCMLQRYPRQRYTASKVLEHKWLATFFLKPKQAWPWSCAPSASKQSRFEAVQISSGWRTAAKPRADTGAALARVSATLAAARILDGRAGKGIRREGGRMKFREHGLVVRRQIRARQYLIGPLAFNLIPLNSQLPVAMETLKQGRMHLTSLAESCSRGQCQLLCLRTQAYPRAYLDLSWGSTLAHYEIRAARLTYASKPRKSGTTAVTNRPTLGWSVAVEWNDEEGTALNRNAHFAQRSGRCPWTAMHAEAESASVAMQGGAVSSGRAPYPAHGAGITIAAGPFPMPAPGSPIIAGRPVRKVAAPHAAAPRSPRHVANAPQVGPMAPRAGPAAPLGPCVRDSTPAAGRPLNGQAVPAHPAHAAPTVARGGAVVPKGSMVVHLPAGLPVRPLQFLGSHDGKGQKMGMPLAPVLEQAHQAQPSPRTALGPVKY
ncbi:unnamed protein product [Symbiodinium sp. CCMP2456]|nr:unnamed protein product [Symbiodinium sp. CCMP2456]